MIVLILSGQFPFYDSAPQELFNKIKSAEFTIPEDGRVSEDTVSVIRYVVFNHPITCCYSNISTNQEAAGDGSSQEVDGRTGSDRD